MRNAESDLGASPAKGEGSPADGSRRAFVKRAALISLPVVLATIPSRTVWAGPRRPTGAQLDASAGGSVNPSGNTATSKVKSLF
jgi:hypothetical protein